MPESLYRQAVFLNESMPKRQRKSKWVEAGFVGVNSGSIVIMDVVDAIYRGGEAIEKWSEDMEKFPRNSKKLVANFHRLKYTLRNQFDKEVGVDGLISRTGYGDGLYRIWARLDEEGRVMELRIIFDTAYGYDDKSKEMHDISLAEVMRKLTERE